MGQVRAILTGIVAVAAFAGGSVALAHGGRDGGRGDGPGRQAAPAAAQVFTLDRAFDAQGNPEGVAFDRPTGAFFVSRVGTGAIFRGTLDDPTVHPFIDGATAPSTSPLATGLKVRDGRLYVAGATTGTIKVFDLATKALLRTVATRAAGDGDGLLLDRGRLVVVQGADPAVPGGADGVLTYVRLRRHRTVGEIVAQRTDPALAGPSTVARARDRLLVANANFAGNGPPFTVSALDRRGGGGGGHGGRAR
jgi:hypothetical protein